MAVERMEYNLPSILEGQGKHAGIAMERALKQISKLLEDYAAIGHESAMLDKLQASIDDVDLMLSRIKTW